MPPFRLRSDALTPVEVLLYVQALWKSGYAGFPSLRGLSPAPVLARMPEQDVWYQQGEAGLRTILREGQPREGQEKRPRETVPYRAEPCRHVRARGAKRLRAPGRCPQDAAGAAAASRCAPG